MGAPRTLTKKQVTDMLAKGTSLCDVDLRGVDLSGLCFDHADLRMAKLGQCNLSRATFRGTNLAYASFWQADCKDACFDGAILEEVDFDLTNLDGCTFRNARIRKSIFPVPKINLDDIAKSVRTGARIQMAGELGV